MCVYYCSTSVFITVYPKLRVGATVCVYYCSTYYYRAVRACVYYCSTYSGYKAVRVGFKVITALLIMITT